MVLFIFFFIPFKLVFMFMDVCIRRTLYKYPLTIKDVNT